MMMYIRSDIHIFFYICLFPQTNSATIDTLSSRSRLIPPKKGRGFDPGREGSQVDTTGWLRKAPYTPSNPQNIGKIPPG